MKTFFKIFGVLVLLAGAGVGYWWFFVDIEQRSLFGSEGYGSSDEEAIDASWRWLASHGDRPVVREHLIKVLEGRESSLPLGPPMGDYLAKFVQRVDTTLKVTPAKVTEAKLARLAMTYWARLDYAPAMAWVEPAAQEQALIAALEEMKRSWRDSKTATVEPAHAEAARLIAELEKRGVPHDSQKLVKGSVGVWLRFRAPAAKEAFEAARTKFPDDFQKALIDRLIDGTDFSDRMPDEIEAEILVNELGALKPEFTRDLMQAVARLCDRKATPRLLKAWGPESIEAMRKLRDSFESYAQTEADKLLGASGSAEAGAVERKVQSLSAYLYGGGAVMAENYNRDDLSTLTSCYHQFNSRLDSVIPQVIDDLSEMPAEALVQSFTTSTDVVTLHLVSRALAKAAPEKLALAMVPLWEQFVAPARAAEAVKLRRDKLEPLDSLLYQQLAPQLWEGVQALSELKTVDQQTLKHLWPGVSSPSHVISRATVELLDKHLADDAFVAGLFAYLDLRSSYTRDEVTRWTELMQTRANQKKLGTLLGALEKAVGGAENVPMVHKLVALGALSKSSCACGPVLERFAKDPGTYESVKFREDSNGNETDKTRTVMQFSDLAKTALSR
ncbi:MAG: hypothetical protein QM817_04465 [Archangium sp.]